MVITLFTSLCHIGYRPQVVFAAVAVAVAVYLHEKSIKINGYKEKYIDVVMNCFS